jgi:hypothetical protein
VYNSGAYPIKGIAFGDWVKLWLKMLEEIPLNNIMWKPAMHLLKYKSLYYMNVIFLHLIPGLLIDGLIKLSGNKPLYVNI